MGKDQLAGRLQEEGSRKAAEPEARKPDRHEAQAMGKFWEIGPGSLRSSVRREPRVRPGAEPKARVDHQTLRSRGGAVREVPRSENGTSVRKQEETSPPRTESARSV